MSNIIHIPDLGDVAEATVVDVLVKVGDEIQLEQPIIVLEGDKATMEVPADKAGVVEAVLIKAGDVVAVNTSCIQLSANSIKPIAESFEKTEEKVVSQDQAVTVKQVVDLVVPDLGDAAEATVIEVLVKIDDEVKLDQPVATLEGDKATMELPADQAGVIKEVFIKQSDTVTSGQVVLKIEVQADISSKVQVVEAKKSVVTQTFDELSVEVSHSSSSVYAGPSVRKLARELGVDLSKVKASGRKGRLTKLDVKNFVKNALVNGVKAADGLNLVPWPKVDPSAHGPVEIIDLTKFKQISGAFLHRNWVKIPHVTQFDKADISVLETWRKQNKAKAEHLGCKISPLILVIKLIVDVLKEFPCFNASLSNDGKSLIKKKYYNIGVAVDSPNGLLVPVIKDVDKKNIVELAIEISNVAKQARTKGLSQSQMQGSSFTISSLGGIGGTYFTPIVNAPDVAILGLSKASFQPAYEDGSWVPKLMLPLSLSYDHRVIDGADGARFIVELSKSLALAEHELDILWPKNVKGEV